MCKSKVEEGMGFGDDLPKELCFFREMVVEVSYRNFALWC